MQRIVQAARHLPLVALCLTLSGVLLAGCALHPGGDQIAYQRGGQLWVVNSDGSLPRELAPSGILGYSWSPDHHELVFRYGASAPQAPGATWAAPESIAELAVVSISGGQPTQISATANGLDRSDAWWDPQGNRLLYREYTPGASAVAPLYIESQNDQPVGIASKVILGAAALPTLSPDGARVAVIDPTGAVRVGPATQLGAVIARGALTRLPGDGFPARLLWQPGHDALVYPGAGQDGASTLNLVGLTAPDHQIQITSVSGLRDMAFSPDGSLLLLATPTGYLVWPLGGNIARAAISENDALAQAYWSPDGRWLLIEDRSGARLIRTSDWSVQASLVYTQPLIEPQTDSATPWRPAAVSPWSGDSSAFTFASAPATWQGKALAAPTGGATAGLYVEQVGASAAQGAPTLIASGNDITAPGWSYPDPSTSLLMAAAG